jgi:hypothetical protein
MITFFDLIIVALVLFYAYMGWEAGMWTAGIAGLELFGCVTAAVLLHEGIAAFLVPVARSTISDGLSQTWVLFLVFAAVAWGTFAAIRFKFHKTEPVNTDVVDIDPLSDRIGGVIAGGLGGAILVGGVLVNASMLPLLAPMKPSGDRMLLDAGKFVLSAAGHFVLDRPDGQPLPIWGEPAVTKANKQALLANEPWIDVDDSGEFSDADRFRDVDGSGTFSKDIYFIDVDRDGTRRVGLVDKYVVGSWDDLLRSLVRQRDDVKKPEPKKKKKKGEEDPEEIVPVDEF